ncbi:hypothetical protein I6J77_09910 [Rhodanobacter sp. FDAARGOS 1247]|uniref:hypothetical protein n=1 Tax=Rhodanobacter sp. FDAARGOS 1247 TaxID=2778082 RepID=UPI0019501F56|nr:hypothetical protein [Rhodanobacter sp. FDAARGOS 1247]QRP62469.1 hypothetical protein I6J77_09910 [Rhodanobacter sp. FDAARGOS 1247]
MSWIFASIVSAVFGAGIMWLILKRKIEWRSRLAADLEIRVRDLEKQIHLNETAFLAKKNEAEHSRLEDEKKIRSVVFQDGYEHGLTEGRKDHLVEIANLKADFRENIGKVRDDAAQQARNELKLEYEARSAVFSVRIDPYVKIEKDAGIIFTTHNTFTGYQYQLLINGIPAFKPHVIVQHSEEIKDVDQARVDQLITIAQNLANTAAQTYLGSAPEKAVIYGSEVVKRVTKNKAPVADGS